MYGWEGKPFDDIAQLTVKRDPRRYPVGCTTGDGERQVTQWFRNVPELTQYLVRMEPQRWGLRRATLIELKPLLEAALTSVAVTGLDEAARDAYNACVAPHYRVIRWGRSDLGPHP